MLNNWTELLANLRKAAGTFGKANPKMMQASRRPRWRARR